MHYVVFDGVCVCGLTASA